ncbi:MAG: alpha/beta fold hydrolase [Mycoplasmoidaceae bacterium]
MRKFDEERIQEYDLKVGNELFPFTEIAPITKHSKSDILVIFLCGLNANSNFIKYWNNGCFDQVYLISYDPRGQSNNQLKPSQKVKTYLKDLDNVINEYLKRNPAIKKIYLIGESWGSNLSFLYNKYYPNKITGALGWNMPYEVIDTSKEEDNSLILKLKVLITLLTGIDTYEKSILTEDMTNNASLRRLIINSRRYYLSNKIIIASWLSFKRSWKYFLKNQNNFDFLYIQSGDDILGSKKVFKKNINKEKIMILKKGTHLLSFDIEMANELFAIIKKFIEK